MSRSLARWSWEVSALEFSRYCVKSGLMRCSMVPGVVFLVVGVADSSIGDVNHADANSVDADTMMVRSRG